MPADPNWARYIFASVATYLKTIANENALPAVVEGLDERDETFMESTDRIEIRINGPYSQELSQDYFRIWVDANVLLTSRMDANKGAYAIQRYAGIFQSAMDYVIPIWNYGDQAGDYDPLDTTKQIFLGCLSPRQGTAESIKVFHFGQVEKTDRVKQSIVDARYFMYLESGIIQPGESFPPSLVAPAVESEIFSAETDSNVVTGTPLYVKGNTHVDIAASNSAATTGVIGIAVVNASATFAVKYIANGRIELPDWTAITGSALLDPGALYYLSGTPGQLTETAPTSGFLVSVGRAANTTDLDIEIGNPIRL